MSVGGGSEEKGIPFPRLSTHPPDVEVFVLLVVLNGISLRVRINEEGQVVG